LYKTIKNSPILLFFVKLIFTGIVLTIFYQQLQKISWTGIQSITIVHPLSLGLAIILGFFNHYFEYRKWKATLTFLEETTQTVQSYLAGVTTGFLTPSLLGNFIGRMYYYPRIKRSKIIVLTFLGNGAQFLASIFFGLLSLAFVGQKQLNIPPLHLGFILLGVTCILFIYFIFDKIPIPILKWNAKVAPLLAGTSKLRLHLLVLSFSRYLVFSFQYLFLFHAFGFSISFELLLWVWQIYFWSTLTPSLWLGKLVIRESIALWVLVPILGHPATILLSSVSLWVVNQGLIALASIPFLKKQVK
jgi:hypothetical protein